MHEVDTTEGLLSRVAGGEHSAFAALYDKVAGQVYGEISRVLWDPTHSEEVAQEVLLEVWRTAPRYDRAQGCAAAWILTPARRRAIDRVRAEQAARDRTERAASKHTGRNVDVVAEALERQADAEEVRRGLSGCSELQREAIELRFYRGYSYPELAQQLEAPMGTVKTRLRDGLTRLRQNVAMVH